VSISAFSSGVHTCIRLSGGALRRAVMYSHGHGDGLSGPARFYNHMSGVMTLASRLNYYHG